MSNACKIFAGKPEGKRPHVDLRIGGMIILEWILGKYDGNMWTRIVWLRIGTSDRLL
jgi:hypothetical protein